MWSEKQPGVDTARFSTSRPQTKVMYCPHKTGYKIPANWAKWELGGRSVNFWRTHTEAQFLLGCVYLFYVRAYT